MDAVLHTSHHSVHEAIDKTHWPKQSEALLSQLCLAITRTDTFRHITRDDRQSIPSRPPLCVPFNELKRFAWKKTAWCWREGQLVQQTQTKIQVCETHILLKESLVYHSLNQNVAYQSIVHSLCSFHIPYKAFSSFQCLSNAPLCQ